MSSESIIMLRLIWLQLQKVVPEQELEPRVFWRTYGTIAWVSFLFAGIATMLFFATFDPIEITSLATYPFTISSIGAYTLGFLLFWALCFCCTTLSCILLSLPINKRRKQLPNEQELD
jgi:hypothetical protein